MKVFVIIKRDDGKVVAISESKKDVLNYMIEKRFTDEDYFWAKIKKEKVANQLLIDFDDLYLEHDEYLDMVLTRVELQMIHDVIGEEKARIESTLFDLEHFLKNYSFNKKEREVLVKAHDILDKAKKKKKLKKVIDLEQFIGYISKSKNFANIFRDKLNETKEKFYLFINMKD